MTRRTIWAVGSVVEDHFLRSQGPLPQRASALLQINPWVPRSRPSSAGGVPLFLGLEDTPREDAERGTRLISSLVTDW